MSGIHEPKASYAEARCPFCGDSPVNHFATKIEGTLGVVSNALATSSIGRPIFGIAFRTISPMFERTLLPFLYALGIAGLTDNIETASSIRTRVLWLEAQKRGIILEQFTVFGGSTDVFRAKLGGRYAYFRSMPVPSELARNNVAWMDDKFLMKKKLQAAGVPIPAFASAVSLKEAQRAFRRIAPASAVVKPRAGSRGRHTAVYITSPEDLALAFRRAKMLNRYVEIEEQLMGSVCRATVVAGALRGFLKADPPRVVGDGVHTVRELIEIKNANRVASVADVVIKEELIEQIRRQGFTLDAVIPAGREVPLLFRTGRLFGGETREMCAEVHPKLREEIERAAAVLGTPLVGFDVVIAAPDKDPSSQRWGIIEANTVPFIDLHDFALYGKPANVAQYVWDLWK